MTMDLFRLFRALPGALQFAWGVLWIGVAALATGYFLEEASWSWAGLGCFLGGYGVAIIDLFVRKEKRSEAASFYTAITIAPLLSAFLAIFVLVIAGVVWVIRSLPDDFSAAHALRLLHFAGVLTAFSIATGISSVMRRGEGESEEEG